MNKELILKYKEEFDQWLDGSELLFKLKQNGYWLTSSSEDLWQYNVDEIVIICNDKYKDIRIAYYDNELERLEYFTLMHKWEDWIVYRNYYDEAQAKNGLSRGFIDAYPAERPQMFRIKGE